MCYHHCSYVEDLKIEASHFRSRMWLSLSKLTKQCVNMIIFSTQDRTISRTTASASFSFAPSSVSFFPSLWLLNTLVQHPLRKNTLQSYSRSAIAGNVPPFFQPCIQSKISNSCHAKINNLHHWGYGESGVPVRGVSVVCAGFDRWTCGFIMRTGLSTVINSLSN